METDAVQLSKNYSIQFLRVTDLNKFNDNNRDPYKIKKLI